MNTIKFEFASCREVAVVCMSLGRAPERKVILFNDGHKYREARDELVDAGLGVNSIGFLVHTYGEVARAARIRLYWTALRALVLRHTLRLRRQHRGGDYVHVLSIYILARKMLAAMQPRCWAILGDLSPHLIAIASAANDAGHSCMSWQCDYLDFKRFPVRPQISAVLNSKGIELAQQDFDSPAVVWREAPEPKPVFVEQTPILVGVLLNAFAGDEEIELLRDIQDMLRIPMEIRLHPRSKLTTNVFPAGLSKAPADESLETFASRTSLIICSNTSAQLKVLCMGTPVVQVPGLDSLPFDHHGYVARGIIMGIERISELKINKVAQFYDSGNHLVGLRNLLGPAKDLRHPTLREGVAAGLFQGVGISLED